MSDRSDAGPREPTIQEIVAGTRPMGDLGRFVIRALTEDEEDEYFAILEDA